MSDEILKEISAKRGVKLEVLLEIIDCERKHVYKKSRPVLGDLRVTVQKAIKGEKENDN